VGEDLNILIGGEAGQGLVTVGQLLSRALVRAGWRICVTQVYMSRVRGGHNSWAIRVGAGEQRAAAERIDLLVALDEETVAAHREAVAPGGLLLSAEGVDPLGLDVLAVPFGDLAEPRQENVAALGVVGALLDLDEELLARAVEELFGTKHPEAAGKNREALAASRRWAAGTGRALRIPGVPSGAGSRAMVNGNEAIALGALSAGLRFLAFYPMTPSTSVSLTVVAHAAALGVVAEQAEDEIAAVNMAVGASFAGAPAMVATSGGGFALMGEGVSLAAMTETPLVVVVAQRPGPATGLPTRTGQEDLDFVLGAGHGEFPRAVLAPGDVEECFALARKAFFLAEMAQGPVFLLTDQWLADSYRAVDPFDAAALPQVQAGWSGPVDAPYRRYAITGDGVSPRLLPGTSEHLVVADSDEHDEAGHITEDLGLRVRMVDKRLRKGEILAAEAVLPRREGDADADLLLVSWGSTGGAVAEAVSRLRAAGTRAASLHFAQPWPLVPEAFLPALRAAGSVVFVEGNAGGQFERLVRRETGFAAAAAVRRYDGLPVTAEYILARLPGGAPAGTQGG